MAAEAPLPLHVPGADVAVVGAGIVGLSCCHYLLQRGATCVLVDPQGPGTATSFGNAGSISVGNVMPQATPGIALRGLRMLLDRNAPLKLDWRHLPGYWGWLLRFVHAGARGGLPAIQDALHALNHAARAHWLELAAAVGASELLRESGYLHVYGSASGFRAAAAERRAMHERKVRFEVLDRRHIEELEPAIGLRFRHGSFQPDALALTDPGGFCERLHRSLLERGLLSIRASVQAVHRLADGIRLDTSEGPVFAGQAVVAAGIWSDPLVRPLGARLPLVPARGYHLMYPKGPDIVRRPTLWAERYMVVSPMAGGVRMTSIKELTVPDAPPRWNLIRRRDADAHALFPALGRPVSEWAGLRPCTPDSLPVIDHVAERVVVATGHGHLGMTQGPVTGALVAQLLAKEPTAIPLQPYRATRFL